MSSESQLDDVPTFLKTEVVTLRALRPAPSTSMSSQHLRIELLGTYLDPNNEGEKKTAFKAQLYYRLPLPYESQASKSIELKICNNISTVEFAREWAEPKGLIVKDKGTFNFSLVQETDNANEQVCYYFEIGGTDAAGVTFLYGQFGRAIPVLAKMRTNRAWKAAMKLKRPQTREQLPFEVTVKTVHLDTATEECKCHEHAEDWNNSTKIKWELKSTNDLSQVA